MITEENWINFIRTFLKAEVSDEWIHHVATGWNHKKNEPGCNCSYTWYSGPEECEIYIGVREAKEKFSLANVTDTEVIDPEPTIPIDLAGVESFIERGHDDFSEDDEPIEEVVEAFNEGEQGTTVNATSTDDFLSALRDPDETANIQRFEEDGPGHGYWEKGDH